MVDQRSRDRPARLLPALNWLGHYQRAWLRGELVAALTTWALVVPQAIAYAQIAQLPPQAGLFAAFAGLLGYALAGSSRQLVVSPTSATAAISAALVAPVAWATRPASTSCRPPWPSSSGSSWWCWACCTWGSCRGSSRRRCRPGSCSAWD
jgi:MFS superfamily sulfate permease-like transporter